MNVGSEGNLNTKYNKTHPFINQQVPFIIDGGTPPSSVTTNGWTRLITDTKAAESNLFLCLFPVDNVYVTNRAETYKQKFLVTSPTHHTLITLLFVAATLLL